MGILYTRNDQQAYALPHFRGALALATRNVSSRPNDARLQSDFVGALWNVATTEAEIELAQADVHSRQCHEALRVMIARGMKLPDELQKILGVLEGT